MPCQVPEQPLIRGHEKPCPIMSLLSKGVISYEGEYGEGRIPVSSGFVQVRNNKVYACIIQKED